MGNSVDKNVTEITNPLENHAYFGLVNMDFTAKKKISKSKVLTPSAWEKVAKRLKLKKEEIDINMYYLDSIDQKRKIILYDNLKNGERIKVERMEFHLKIKEESFKKINFKNGDTIANFLKNAENYLCYKNDLVVDVTYALLNKDYITATEKHIQINEIGPARENITNAMIIENPINIKTNQVGIITNNIDLAENKTKKIENLIKPIRNSEEIIIDEKTFIITDDNIIGPDGSILSLDDIILDKINVSTENENKNQNILTYVNDLLKSKPEHPILLTSKYYLHSKLNPQVNNRKLMIKMLYNDNLKDQLELRINNDQNINDRDFQLVIKTIGKGLLDDDNIALETFMREAKVVTMNDSTVKIIYDDDIKIK